MRKRTRDGARGFTLIEVMVALVVLLIGLLGLMRLQLVGITANQASRSHTIAVQLARELATGLERLNWNDPLLQATYTGSAAPASPTVFGPLLQGGSVVASGYRAWDDADPVAGVRLDAAITERDGDGTPTYKRRWTVWDMQGAAGGPVGSKLVAVSVTYHERATSIAYEVVYYAQLNNIGSTFANASAYN